MSFLLLFSASQRRSSFVLASTSPLVSLSFLILHSHALPQCPSLSPHHPPSINRSPMPVKYRPGMNEGKRKYLLLKKCNINDDSIPQNSLIYPLTCFLILGRAEVVIDVQRCRRHVVAIACVTQEQIVWSYKSNHQLTIVAGNEFQTAPESRRSQPKLDKC